MLPVTWLLLLVTWLLLPVTWLCYLLPDCVTCYLICYLLPDLLPDMSSERCVYNANNYYFFFRRTKKDIVFTSPVDYLVTIETLIVCVVDVSFNSAIFIII